MTSKPLIELEDVCKSYPMAAGDVHALKGVTLRIQEGEFVSIVGNSGSGKSTLLYLLGLLTMPTQGVYRFSGKETQALSDEDVSQIRADNIGFIFQSFHLVPQLTIMENVLLGARYTHAEEGDRVKAAESLLKEVGLSQRAHHRPAQLSGGEMQRTAVARALLTSPSLILADEPTGNLDQENGKHIFELLEKLHQDQGKTIVLVTHNLTLAAQCPRQIRLQEGSILDESTT